MSSYIIAGSADSLDTAYCEEIAKKIKSKYKNIDFRVVIKHPSEWENYLQQICRIYGFLNKSNPIIYTYHGKIIGNKDAFIDNAIKYFGLSEDALIVPNLTNAVNIKLAEQQLAQKNIQINNIRNLQQRIDHNYQRLLKNGSTKHNFKDSEQFLVNGIEYRLRDVEGLCEQVDFPYYKQIKVEKQVIEPDNIDLLALSMQDRIQDDNAKQAFVTNNLQINTESMQKMSEASKTNRLHSSAMSRDGDSKANKQSSKQKQQIDEQFDDVTDYNDHNMEQLCISEVGDHFYLSFQKQNNTHIPGQMVLYYNQAHNNGGNSIRIYNDGRGVIGHRTLVKQIHYEHNQQSNHLHHHEKNDKNESQIPSIEKIDQLQKPQQQAPIAAQQKKEPQKQKGVAEKSKTEPNIQEHKQEQPPKKEDSQQVISQPHSDLNLVSNLNYHTLYILKPLSNQELKRVLYVVQETNTICCLQFLPENPNPKIKIYQRNQLLGAAEKNTYFPIQKFIHKQFQDGEYQTLVLDQNKDNITVNIINDIGFTHYYYEHPEKIDDEQLAKAIKLMVDNLLDMEEQLGQQIGYNLIITRKFTMIVAITQTYKVYGNNNLYFDGLAYLGYVCVVKVTQAYQMSKKSIDSGESIREALARCSGYQVND